MDVEITELEKIDAERVDGVGMPASGIPILLMKSLPGPVAKDWASWDAAHSGSGSKPSATGDSKASAADAVARAKQTIADHKAGKKVSAADLRNAHDVHEAHLAHEARLKAEAEAAKKGLAKGQRDCPKCEKSYDADHEGSKCENCGADLPDVAKADGDGGKCKTCGGSGTIMDGHRDCPDCDAGKKKTAAKSLARAIIAAPLEVAKAIGADGAVDEAPDVDKGNQILALIGEAIAAEAQEMAAGQAGEACDIIELAYAAQAVRAWRDGEEAVSMGDVMPASSLMQSAAFIQSVAKGELQLRINGWEPAKVAEFTAMLEVVAKAKHSTADRKKLAEAGNALSDGSYPIADEEDLKSAAILAQSGHGDVDGAKRLIGRRSKELGVKNPLSDDDKGDGASKSQIAQEGTDVDTVVKGTGDLNKAVEDAVTKAMAPLQERIKALDAELAKVKATPVPGGPVLSRNVQVKQPGGVVREDWAAKAAYFREQAETVSDRQMQDGYRKLAREADAKAVTPPATT